MDAFERQVREKIRAILNGKVPLSEVTGATSIRCVIGLVIATMEGLTTMSDAQAWDYIDYGNARLVRDLRGELWSEVCDWRAAERRAGRRV